MGFIYIAVFLSSIGLGVFCISKTLDISLSKARTFKNKLKEQMFLFSAFALFCIPAFLEDILRKLL